jgi:hypothetical protein
VILAQGATLTYSKLIRKTWPRSAARLSSHAWLITLAVGCSDGDGKPAADPADVGDETSVTSTGGLSPAEAPNPVEEAPGMSTQGANPAGETLPNAPIATMTPSGEQAPTLGELAQQPTAMADWTIVIYGNGDSNLSNALLEDMAEMQSARLNSRVNVVVLADFDASQVQPTTDPPVHYPAGHHLYRVPGGGAPLQVLGEGEEVNLDDPTILSSLVQDVFSALPARHRGLVLWDHGGGWHGFGGDAQDGTSAGSHNSPEVLARAVANGLAAAGITATPPLDFFSFDACLMAGLESAYPFRDLARIYIADAELDYGAGWNYGATLSYIADHPDALIEELAVAEVSHWDAQHVTQGSNDTLLRSHVALDLSRLDFVAASAAQLSRAFVDSPTFDPLDLGRSAFFALAPYASDLAKSGNAIPGLRDFGQLASALATTQSDAAVALAAQNLRRALDGMVLARSQGTVREANGQVGINVEQTLGNLVTQDLLDDYETEASGWVAASNWNQVLAFAARAADQAPPVFEQQLLNAQASRSAPPTLQLQTSDLTAARAMVAAGVSTEQGGLRALGAVGVGRLAPDAINQFEWGGRALVFADGQPGMVTVWLDTGETAAPVLGIPGLFSVPSMGAQAEAMLLFDVDPDTSGALASQLAIEDDELSVVLSTEELAALAPDATFTPVYVELDATSRVSLVSGSPIAVRAEGFALTPRYLPPGEYALITTVTSMWGNEATESAFFTLTESLEP